MKIPFLLAALLRENRAQGTDRRLLGKLLPNWVQFELNYYMNDTRKSHKQP